MKTCHLRQIKGKQVKTFDLFIPTYKSFVTYLKVNYYKGLSEGGVMKSKGLVGTQEVGMKQEN